MYMVFQRRNPSTLTYDLPEMLQGSYTTQHRVLAYGLTKQQAERLISQYTEAINDRHID